MKLYLLLPFLLLLIITFHSCSDKDTAGMENNENPSSPYFKIHFDPDKPGCGDCHNNREESKNTFAAKANEGWEDHNFDIYEKLMTINDCLLCHSVDSGGNEGAIAPTPLRTIVHQVHIPSPYFEGNCFTCHYIMGDSSADLYNYSD